MTHPSGYLRGFNDLRLEDVPLVGGKSASLGELYQQLSGQGIRVPYGFALTENAYRDSLTAAGAWAGLHALLDDLDVTDVAQLADRAAEGVGTIAAAFYPKPVIVRLSDFKTNEYAELLGGTAFEPHEANPMLGLLRTIAIGREVETSTHTSIQMKPVEMQIQIGLL